jgi:hypothetical protein
MSKQREPLPSVPVYDPALRVLRVIGEPTRTYPERRIRLRSSVDPEAEQRALDRQMQEQETFWRLRFRNRP